MSSSEHEDLVAQFSAVTGANPSVAQSALAATNYNLEQSVALYYEQMANAPDGDIDEDMEEAAASAHPVPQPSSSAAPPTAASSSSAKRTGAQPGGSRPKQMSFRDLQRENEDGDDEEGERPQDFFAGGEKSGLAVQNPDGQQPADHFRNIMNQARQNRERPPADDEDEDAPARPSNFSGRAQTLGGDDAPSRVVSDPAVGSSRGGRQALPRVTRTLHMWTDGVSVDDGPLFRFDDPANADILRAINQGRAPKSLLNVEANQEVDLNLEPHKGEVYKPPPKKYKPFGGSGQRLGSPTPGPAPVSSVFAAAPSSESSSTAATGAPAEVSVDAAQPTLQLQIRLGDGTRLASRFNTTHTIGDVYDFVRRASTESQSRQYVLQTTFPPTEFTDHSKVLGEIPDFKRGGVLVQKWK